MGKLRLGKVHAYIHLWNSGLPQGGTLDKLLHPLSLSFPICHITILTPQQCCEHREISTQDSTSQMVSI